MRWLPSCRPNKHRPPAASCASTLAPTPVVGKTYAMLSAAQRERQSGRTVLVGLVETHGRAETEQQLHGLRQLPRKPLPYQGRQLPEFDLDGALEQHPDVLLLDELAHSNVPGARHPKRWQDVEELPDAGIKCVDHAECAASGKPQRCGERHRRHPGARNRARPYF